MDNTKQVFKKCISIHLEGRFYSKEIYCEGLRVVFEATHKQLQSNLKISGASKNT